MNEAMLTAGLAADKSLVGALDSACSRTCAAEQWLREYLAKLSDAPSEVQALVEEKPETENFKFGNGGVLPSATRWRIPAIIGGRLVFRLGVKRSGALAWIAAGAGCPRRPLRGSRLFQSALWCAALGRPLRCELVGLDRMEFLRCPLIAGPWAGHLTPNRVEFVQ